MTIIRSAAALCAASFLFAAPVPSMAQGVVRGAQEGAAVGNRAAGPVGGVVGGAVGGIFGGVAGGVKGVLGIPQTTASTGPRSTSTSRAARSNVLSRTAIRSELLGRPLAWRSEDGSQSGTTVFYTDNTAALMNSSIPNTPNDTGRWSLRNNRVCVMWEHINPGNESCSTWTRTGPKTYRDADGIAFSAN